MADNAQRQYLNYEGLTKFWDQVKDYYQNASHAVAAAKKIDTPITIKIEDSNKVFSGSINNVDFSSSITIVPVINDATTTMHGFMSPSSVALLASLASSDHVNAINSISLQGAGETSGTALTIDKNKNVNINLSAYALASKVTSEINEKVASVFKYKGTVDSYSSLPTEGLVEGDVYQVKKVDQGTVIDGTVTETDRTFVEFVYVAKKGDVEAHWEELGLNVDLSGYDTSAEVASKVAAASTAASIAASTNASNLSKLGSDLTTGSKVVAHATEADGAKAASKVVNALTFNETRTNASANANNGSFDGSVAKTVDLTKYALVTDTGTSLDTKVDKVKAAVASHLATFVSGGNIADSGYVITSNGDYSTPASAVPTLQLVKNLETTYTFSKGADGVLVIDSKIGDVAQAATSTSLGDVVNKINEVQVNGTALTIASKVVNIDMSAYCASTVSLNETSIEPVSAQAVANAIAGTTFIDAIPVGDASTKASGTIYGLFA